MKSRVLRYAKRGGGRELHPPTKLDGSDGAHFPSFAQQLGKVVEYCARHTRLLGDCDRKTLGTLAKCSIVCFLRLHTHINDVERGRINEETNRFEPCECVLVDCGAFRRSES